MTGVQTCALPICFPVTIEKGDNVVIGGNSAVQQFTRIGKFAMIGGMTGVEKDVIPYGLVTGNRSHLALLVKKLKLEIM